MAVKGIDVSKWQGDIIWASVKAAGIGFAILKAGGSDAGFYTDPKFEKNYKEAKAVGMPLGAYYFVGSKCISYADGKADAERFIKMLQGKTLEYPVFIDIETTSPDKKDGATQAVLGFYETMVSAGWYCGVYASDIYGFQERLDVTKLECVNKWVARYGSKPTYVTDYGMWQYSESGSVNGISGNVDLDEATLDYPTIIKNAGMNGMTAEEKTTATDCSADYWENKYYSLLAKIKALTEEG